MVSKIEIPCYACDGRGYFDYEDKRGQCPGCNGSGRINVDEIERPPSLPTREPAPSPADDPTP